MGWLSRRDARMLLYGGIESACLKEFNGGGTEPARSGRFDSLVQSAKNFFLPAGYPGSLTSDYTSYMLWQFPVHITGWASSTLVTSTLLQAAVAKGLKDPSARVIQTHFAVQANVGEVVAKEEVYKVMAQLVGLGCGVVLLSSPYIAESYWSLVTTWAVIRSTHLAFRFKSLSVLEFDSLNFKRTAILARAHVSGAAELPSVQAVNQKERLWLPRRLTSPRINLGCSLADLSALLQQQSANRMPITELLSLYRDEQHVLIMDDNGAFSVMFKVPYLASTIVTLSCRDTLFLPSLSPLPPSSRFFLLTAFQHLCSPHSPSTHSHPPLTPTRPTFQSS
ncbi:unnamed protein product [Closterium sp. Yama58-4]|nr:unnamed protein product [Closterium sp. Yama58-4]